MERLGYDGNDMRRKGHAATGNGKEWTRGGWNSDGLAVPRHDVQWIRTAQRTDTKGDGKEEQYGAVIEKTIA